MNNFVSSNTSIIFTPFFSYNRSKYNEVFVEFRWYINFKSIEINHQAVFPIKKSLNLYEVAYEYLLTWTIFQFKTLIQYIVIQIIRIRKFLVCNLITDLSILTCHWVCRFYHTSIYVYYKRNQAHYFVRRVWHPQ